MEEIAKALQDVPPFNRMPFPALLEACASIQIEYFPADQVILHTDDPPAEFLYIIQRGSVDMIRDSNGQPRIIDTLGEGESFGFVSLLNHQAPLVTVRTRSEVLAYLLPAEIFHQLHREHSAVARFFASSTAERLDHALSTHHAAAEPALFRTYLRDLLRRELISINPDATIRQAARLMRDRNVSSLIINAEPPGILTDRDLRNRVLANGVSDSTPVTEVMTVPVRTLPADSLVFEGLMLMLETGTHHLAVCEDDKIVGIVTNTDILRRQSRSPLFLPRQLERAHTNADLRAYTDQVGDTVAALLDAGARVSDIGRVVAVAHDALQGWLLRELEMELGPPPCPYAWVVLGSQGRFEQTLRTDQDHAIIYADDAPPEARSYFTIMAERMVDVLVQCGFPRCPGNVMASNPRWRQPAQIWQDYFRKWIQQPAQEALLRATIFFDYRQVYGELNVADTLRPIVETARGNKLFLGRLALAAIQHPAPLNLFRQLVVERRGEQRNVLDLKHRGTVLFVDLARLFALESGSAATSTVGRLREAASHSTIQPIEADELANAFELLSLIRLRHQHRQIEGGEAPNNLVSLDSLSALERRELKEAIQAVARIQRGVSFTYQTDLMG